MTLFSADDAALILDVADNAAHFGDYLEDLDRTEELLVLDEQLLAIHVLVKRLGQEIPLLEEAYEAMAASRLIPGVTVATAEYVDQWVAEFGACILTPENIGTEDDCTTHGHELLTLSDVALPVDQVNSLLSGVIVCWGHCDTCGEPCDSEGCVVDRTHEIALD